MVGPMGGMGMPMGMGVPMGMGMNMNMGMQGMRMNDFSFGSQPGGPGGMGPPNGMVPNGMMGNGMFGMSGGQPMGQMMFGQNFAPGFDGAGVGNMGPNMGYDQPGAGPQGWWDGAQRGPMQDGSGGGWQQQAPRQDGMGQPMGMFMMNGQIPPGFDGNMNRGF
jgi:hypothetical protein